MRANEILDALSCLSLRTLSLALRRPSELWSYISHCLRKYDEAVGNGLPSRSPLTPAEDLTITIPAHHSGGGMSFNELVILARVTKALRPMTVFEMGTYNGLGTAIFILNSDPRARPDFGPAIGYRRQPGPHPKRPGSRSQSASRLGPSGFRIAWIQPALM